MDKITATSVTRRRFLKTAGATALAAGTGPAVIIPGRAQPKTLKILRWKVRTDNNRAMLAGEISLTLSAISITRSAENKQLPVNDKLWLAKIPQGPVRRLAINAAVNGMHIWKFARNIDGANQFLVDYISNAPHALLAGQFSFLPSFPQSVPNLAQLLGNDPKANPTDRYQVLADAAEWTVHLGYPRHRNPATNEVMNRSLIAQMFAHAATGKMTPEEALTRPTRKSERYSINGER